MCGGVFLCVSDDWVDVAESHRLSISLSSCLFLCGCAWLDVCLSIGMCLCGCVCVSISVTMCLSVCVCVCVCVRSL